MQAGFVLRVGLVDEDSLSVHLLAFSEFSLSMQFSALSELFALSVLDVLLEESLLVNDGRFNLGCHNGFEVSH